MTSVHTKDLSFMAHLETVAQTPRIPRGTSINGAAVSEKPSEIVWEGSGVSARSLEKTQNTEAELKHFLDNDRELSSALRTRGLPPDVRNGARVFNAVVRNSSSYSDVAGAVANVVTSMGKNPVAIDQLKSASARFTRGANLKANSAPEVSLFNVVTARSAAQSAQASVTSSLKSQLTQIDALLVAQRSYIDSLRAAADKTATGGTAKVLLLDYQLKPDGNVQAVADAPPPGTKVTAETKTTSDPQPTQGASSGETKSGSSGETKAFGGNQSVEMSSESPPRVVALDNMAIHVEIDEREGKVRALEKARAVLVTSQKTDKPVQLSPELINIIIDASAAGVREGSAA